MKISVFFPLIFFLIVSLNTQSQTTDYVTGITSPGEFVIYEDYLYFTDTGASRIIKVDLTQEEPDRETVITGVFSVSGIALKGSDLYYSQGSGENKISKINLLDTTPNPIIVIENLSNPGSLEIAGNDLYVAQYSQDKILKIDLIATNPVAVEIGDVDNPASIKINGTALYVAGRINNVVVKFDLSLSNPFPEVVVSGLLLPVGLLVEGNDLYIAEAGASIGDDVISKIDITSSNPSTTIVVGGLYNPLSGLAIYNNVLYIAENFKISKFELPLSINEFDINTISVYPNPTVDYLKISGLTNSEDYKIYNMLGAILEEGTTYNDEKIEVQHLAAGTYFIMLDDNTIKQFVKE